MRKSDNSQLFIKRVSIDWDNVPEQAYYRNIEAISQMQSMDFTKNITFFVGENGSGKSTLLEAIAVSYGLNAEGGTKNYRFSTYSDVSDLSTYVRLGKGPLAQMSYFLRAESFYNVATQAKEYAKSSSGSYSLEDLHEKSHGESFLEFIQQFSDKGLYLMDEPEAALSPIRQMTLFRQIYKMAAEGSQFIIATHSPIILSIPGAGILSFDEGKLHSCNYEETQSFQITEMFINNRQTVVKRLLEDI